MRPDLLTAAYVALAGQLTVADGELVGAVLETGEWSEAVGRALRRHDELTAALVALELVGAKPQEKIR